MAQNWADETTERVINKGLLEGGICLILGPTDTGKTTLAASLAGYLCKSHSVGIVDADVGQSHIGPPATVGWALVESRKVDFSQLIWGGISFVGDVSPVGHLLQFTAAVVQCVQQLSGTAEIIIVDTPGFIFGPAANALWWTAQRILQPGLILAVQRGNEMSGVLAGLKFTGVQLELINFPLQMPVKSPQERQSYRQSQFDRYFRDACLYDINLNNVAVQMNQNLDCRNLINRVVALRDGKGIDKAVGLITDWKEEKNIVVIKAPRIDIQQVCYIIVGDVSIDVGG